MLTQRPRVSAKDASFRADSAVLLMSFEAINNFFAALDTNSDLSRDFDALTPSDDYKQQLCELGKKYGYEFTLEELEDVVKVTKAMQAGEYKAPNAAPADGAQ